MDLGRTVDVNLCFDILHRMMGCPGPFAEGLVELSTEDVGGHRSLAHLLLALGASASAPQALFIRRVCLVVTLLLSPLAFPVDHVF